MRVVDADSDADADVDDTDANSSGTGTEEEVPESCVKFFVSRARNTFRLELELAWARAQMLGLNIRLQNHDSTRAYPGLKFLKASKLFQ